MNDNPHARTFDLPGWPCPPRAHQIPDHAGSYGWVAASSVYVGPEGHLWVDSLARMLPATADRTCVCLAWTEDGLGIWAPRKSYETFRAIEVAGAGELTPIARVLPEPPAAEQTDSKA